jgi:hypothetical protein
MGKPARTLASAGFVVPISCGRFGSFRTLAWHGCGTERLVSWLPDWSPADGGPIVMASDGRQESLARAEGLESPTFRAGGSPTTGPRDFSAFHIVRTRAVAVHRRPSPSAAVDPLGSQAITQGPCSSKGEIHDRARPIAHYRHSSGGYRRPSNLRVMNSRVRGCSFRFEPARGRGLWGGLRSLFFENGSGRDAEAPPSFPSSS